MIHGIGIDIVDIARFKLALLKWGGRLKQRLFTAEELDYCLKQRFPERHLAARFAAKESVVKALGKGISFKNIEIIKEDNGRPCVRVKGLSENFRFALALSHEKELAIAQTVVEKI